MSKRDRVDLTQGPYELGVIGDPVAHSLSPALHQPALDRYGIPARYERWHTPAAELADRVASLRRTAVLGASVTVPHKIAVMAWMDDVSASAMRAGAVNTIVNRDGALFGDNTDIHGFLVTIQHVLEGRRPNVAVVLGAGGAARAVVLALEAAGAREIVVANRDLDRAAQLIADLAPAPARAATLSDDVLHEELPRAEVVVNATSLGWHAGEVPIAERFLDLLAPTAIVADLTYRDTDLLVAASARGLRTTDGLPMLVHQGARAFELWTGYEAPVDTMLEAAYAARAPG